MVFSGTHSRGLALLLGLGRGDPMRDQGIEVLVLVVEPLGVAEDEVAVDQVVEDEGPLLARRGRARC
jgi:hypothetical protein